MRQWKLAEKCVRPVALIASLSLCCTVWAQDASQNSSQAASQEATPEHGKINTQNASPVAPGHFEIEDTYALEVFGRLWNTSGHLRTGGQAHDSSEGLSLTAGIVNNLDVQVSSSYLWLKETENGASGPDHGQGFGDVNFWLRYRFLNDPKSHLEIAYVGGMTAPTGSHSTSTEIGTSQEYWSLNQMLVVTKDWGQWTSDANVGYSLPFGDHRENARGVLSGNAAVGYQVLPWLQPEVELNYAHTFVDGASDSDAIAATAGFVMPVTKWLRLKVAVQQDLWGRNSAEATTCILAAKVAF